LNRAGATRGVRTGFKFRQFESNEFARADELAQQRAQRRRGEAILPAAPTVPISSRSILRRAQDVLAAGAFPAKAAERTAAATGRRIGTLLDDFSPAECANYFVNSGYASV